MPPAGATTVALPPRARPLASGSRLAADTTGAKRRRVVAVCGLGAYVAASWAGLVAHAPTGRVTLAAGCSLAGAAAAAWLAGSRIPRPAAVLLAALATVASLCMALIAIGIPARLLAPAGWATLRHDVGAGLGGLGDATYPYSGTAWSRLVILSAIPLFLALASALALWPRGRAAPPLRAAALVLLVAAYATSVTVAPPSAPLLRGLVLCVLVAAWLWLPRLEGRDGIVALVLVGCAGLAALPVAARLDGQRPWLDYRNWSWSWSALAGGQSFDWNQSYGPLTWPRSGQVLLEARSDGSYYWRTAALDHFDGFRWVQSDVSGADPLELPLSDRPGRFSSKTVRLSRTVRLVPRWVHEISFTVKGLRSPLVVGAGTILSVHGLSNVAATRGALTLPDHSLTAGDSYSVRAYVPQPSPGELRRAPARYPRPLSAYTELMVPRMHTFHPDPGSAAGIPNVPTTVVTKRRLTVPLWGSGESAAAAHALRSSTYGRVYQLARRVTAGAPTPYDAVKRVEHYLRTNYTYSETPPRRSYPLRAFLFRDGIGYCQQFSGAMALMLREIGIPARVAAGFSPGTRGKDGAYVIRDEDAHSWVEVYFNGIGWVPFDPTPAAAPARREAASLGIRSPNAPPTGLAKSQQLGAPIDPGTPSPRARAGSSLPPAWLVLLAAAVVGAALAAARSLRRAARYRALAPAAAAESQLRELASALARVRSWSTRGSTLLELERRLATVVGPASAAYAAALRRARYGRGVAPPPSPAERRALRRELAAGSGTRGRLRALLAIPPLAPAAEGAGPATDG